MPKTKWKIIAALASCLWVSQTQAQRIPPANYSESIAYGGMALWGYNPSRYASPSFIGPNNTMYLWPSPDPTGECVILDMPLEKLLATVGITLDTWLWDYEYIPCVYWTEHYLPWDVRAPQIGRRMHFPMGDPAIPPYANPTCGIEFMTYTSKEWNPLLADNWNDPKYLPGMLRWLLIAKTNSHDDALAGAGAEALIVSDIDNDGNDVYWYLDGTSIGNPWIDENQHTSTSYDSRSVLGVNRPVPWWFIEQEINILRRPVQRDYYVFTGYWMDPTTNQPTNISTKQLRFSGVGVHFGGVWGTIDMKPATSSHP